LALAAHALAEPCGVETAAARLADAVQHPLGLLPGSGASTCSVLRAGLKGLR
jgi:hypothetical protein